MNTFILETEVFFLLFGVYFCYICILRYVMETLTVFTLKKHNYLITKNLLIDEHAYLVIVQDIITHLVFFLHVYFKSRPGEGSMDTQANENTRFSRLVKITLKQLHRSLLLKYVFLLEFRIQLVVLLLCGNQSKVPKWKRSARFLFLSRYEKCLCHYLALSGFCFILPPSVEQDDLLGIC